MRVPFGDFKRQYEPQQDQLEAALLRVARSGWYILGAEVAAFEDEFARFLNARHCVAVGNGTDALILALRALRLPAGSEVITVANAAGYGAVAIREAGLVPRFADVDEHTRNMSPQSLAAAVTPRTRAVLPVHLYGRPAPLDAIAAVCERYELELVEDCAQSHGATYHERRTGTIGRLGCFSFYPSKNLGGLGDGGAIVTDDAELAERLRRLRVYGWERKYHSVDSGGINSRLDELQAAVLRVRLAYLDAANELRRERAAWYRELLSGVSRLMLPEEDAGHVYHLFVVQITGGRRDALREALAARGVGSDIHYPVPTHLEPAWEELAYEAGELPVTERLAETVLSLPCFPELTRAEVEYVASCVREALA